MSAPSAQPGGLDGRNDAYDVGARFRRFAIIVTIPFILLAGRLWYLQIWSGDHYAQLAFNNFIDKTAVPAERGLVFDTRGRVIAGNRPSYDVTVTPAFFAPNDDEQIDVLARAARLKRHLAMTDENLDKMVEQVNRAQGLWRFEPIVVKRNITRDQVANIETDSLHLGGVDVIASSTRYYAFNDLAPHVLGYVNEINESELERLELYGYRPGDMIGRTGIERSFEAVLRGSAGVRAEVVDSRGMPQTDRESLGLLGDWKDVKPVPGKNIILTIDMDLQRIMKAALDVRGPDGEEKYKSGAAVAIDPQTGSILGIASKPYFNPNSWSGRLSRDEHIANDNNPHKPMLDKALLSYFPASTYKVVTALAALEAGLITPTDTLHCPGYYEYGKRKKRFHCWKRGGHDSVNLAQALENSCDVYFYKVGEKLGMDKLAEYAYLLGFGEASGVGVNRESPGLVPTKDWHRENSPDGFQGGFTLSTSIGQGDTRVTPLQMALAYAAIANGGTLYYPQIVDRIETASGQVLFEYPVRVRHELDVAPETLAEIMSGLDKVVNSETGTAYSQRIDYVRVAGKTGTAQVTSKRTKGHEVEYNLRDHAWFAAVAPVDDPEVVVVVFLEHVLHGGSQDAAPVAMEIIDLYFREIRGYDPIELKKDKREPHFLTPDDSDDGGRHLLSEPGHSTPRWRRNPQ